MRKEVIHPATAPKSPVLSPGIKYGNLVFTSGNVGRDPQSGQLVPGGIKEQSRQTLENIKAILEEAGTSMDNVVKATCYVVDLNDRPAFNEVYQEYFQSDLPVRTCVQVAFLGDEVLLEVDVVAGMPT